MPKSWPSRPVVVSTALPLLLVLAAPGWAQKKPEKIKQNRFSDATSVVAVEVPVTVIRDGRAVAGLSAANFEVYDGRTRQEITGFEVVDLGAVRSLDPVGQPVPTAARRHFLLLFDLAFSEPESVVRARRAAQDLVDRFHPTDLAAVAVYTSERGAVPLMSFTSDKRQLATAIETLGLPDLVERAADPLGLVFGKVRGEEPRIDDRRMLAALGRANAAEQALQLDRLGAFTSNFTNLAHYLAPLEGKKHLVYFSEGVPSDLVTGDTDTYVFQQRRARQDVGDFNSEFMFGHTQAQDRLEGMIDAFREASCAIDAVDIGDLRTANEIGGRATGEDALIAMSKDTGGQFFRGYKNLGETMGEVLERTSVTYLLAFQPKKLTADGAYHRLRVKLKDTRRAQVRHRAGYFAPDPENPPSPARQRLELAGVLMGDREGGSLAMNAMTGTVPVEDKLAYVPVLLEIDGRSLGHHRASGATSAGSAEAVELEVYAYATHNETGAIEDFFVERLRRGRDEVRGRSGLKYWGHFDLPPGEYTANLMVRNPRGGTYGVAHRAVSVPAAGEAGALLMPPLFPESPHKWLLVRESPERRRTDVAYPFMAAGSPYVPAARPVVPAKGRTPFFLHGINVTDRFEGEVTSSKGKPVKKATLKVDPPEASPGGRTATAWLETRGLAPGEYELVGRATAATGESFSRSIRFVVE